jgi:hypothetical protein
MQTYLLAVNYAWYFKRQLLLHLSDGSNQRLPLGGARRIRFLDYIVSAFSSPGGFMPYHWLIVDSRDFEGGEGGHGVWEIVVVGG